MLTAICSVNFHLTEGQKVEAVYPPNALDEAELSAVGFSSFPDSMSFELTSRSSVRDTSFCFRMARTSTKGGYLHGFVFCRQRQDERLQRGGEQRSIVILSPFPITNILEPLSQYAGPLCLSQGPESLRGVFEDALMWGPLEWGGSMDLPLGHTLLRADLPELANLPSDVVIAASELSEAPSVAEALADDLDLDTGIPLSLLPGAPGQQAPAVGLYTNSDVFTPFAHATRQLWTFWEMLLIGAPLLVASPNPAACSGATAALLSLIAPLPYCADYRPYFTIHEPAFAALAAGAVPSTEINADNFPSLIGVTNPFIIKSLTHWPNTLSTGFTSMTQLNSGQGSSCGEESNGSTSTNSNGGGVIRRRSTLPSLLRRRNSNPDSLLKDPADALWLEYKPCIRPDEEVLSSLVLPESGDGAARRRRLGNLNSTIIRRHFEDLSRAVVFPLLPYITPAPPPQFVSQPGTATPSYIAPPPLSTLDPGKFVQSIIAGDIAVPDTFLRRFANRQDVGQFYSRLLKGRVMIGWLQARRTAAQAFQSMTWKEAWRHAGGQFKLPGSSFTQEMGEMEDYLEAEASFQSALAAGRKVNSVEDLRGSLRGTFARLPQDIQEAMLLSPERGQLLGNQHS